MWWLYCAWVMLIGDAHTSMLPLGRQQTRIHVHLAPFLFCAAEFVCVCVRVCVFIMRILLLLQCIYPYSASSVIANAPLLQPFERVSLTYTTWYTQSFLIRCAHICHTLNPSTICCMLCSRPPHRFDRMYLTYGCRC